MRCARSARCEGHSACVSSFPRREACKRESSGGFWESGFPLSASLGANDRSGRGGEERGIDMTLRRDHLAGGAIVLAGVLLFAVSHDLPFGTLASPGAGMLPMLVIGLMTAFGVVLVARAGESPPLATVAWGDCPHAVRVVAATAAAVALYTTLGFLITMSLLLFGLTFAIERKPLLNAAAFSIGVTGIAYLLFNTLLKSPLPRGLIWF